MSRYKIGEITYDNLGRAAVALTTDHDLNDKTALGALYDAITEPPDGNGAYVVDLEVAKRYQERKGGGA